MLWEYISTMLCSLTKCKCLIWYFFYFEMKYLENSMVCSCFAVYVLTNNTRFVPYFESCMTALCIYWRMIHNATNTPIRITTQNELFVTGGNVGDPFSVNPTDGIILLAGRLDAETQSSYELTITASDGYNPVSTTVSCISHFISAAFRTFSAIRCDQYILGRRQCFCSTFLVAQFPCYII